MQLLIGALLLFLLLLLFTGYLISCTAHRIITGRYTAIRNFIIVMKLFMVPKYMYPITNPGLDILQYPVILSIILLSDCFFN